MEDNDHRATAAPVTIYSEGATEVLFAERLRALREAADLTQNQLAEQMTQRGIAMHQTTIAKIELNQRPVRLNEAAAFATALRVNVTDLLTDSEGTPETTALRSQLHAATTRRLELSQHLERAEHERTHAEMMYLRLADQLEALEHEEAEIRKKLQAAKAQCPAQRPHQPAQSKARENRPSFAPSPTPGSALAVLLIVAAVLWRARKDPSLLTDIIQPTGTKDTPVPVTDQARTTQTEPAQKRQRNT